MPYPILTLPYPFAIRLHQLLDPFELEALQRASGPYVLNELKPIVKSSKLDWINILAKGRNAFDLSWGRMKIRIPEVDKFLINYCAELTFHHFSNSNFEKPATTTQLIIKPVQIVFHNCHISIDMLKSVSKMTIKPCQLNFRYSSTVMDEDVTFSTIADIFPHLQSVIIGKAYFGWLDDLISTGKSFKAIEIFHDNFDELFSFNAAELYDYIKSLRFPFWILITYKVNANRYAWIVHMIQKFIDPRFDVIQCFGVPMSGTSGVTFRIQLIDNVNTYQDYRYYCL